MYQNDGKAPSGGQSVAWNVRYDKEVPACKSCSAVLTAYGIDHKKTGGLRRRMIEALEDEGLGYYIRRDMDSHEMRYFPLYVRSLL